MSSLQLPGLRGDDPLGFLGAVGLVSLSEQGMVPPLQLWWDGGASPVAAVETEVASVTELASRLRRAFESMVARTGALPGVQDDFPLAGEGSGRDPMRMARPAMAQLYEEADRAWREAGNPWFARWLTALAGEAAVDQRGEVPLTPFYAPTGQMKLRNSLFDKTAEGVTAVDGPEDALTAWKRTRKFKGANFDDRAIRDAAVPTSGSAANEGAPSPTWLAAVGLRCFPLADNGREVHAVGWQRAWLYPGFTTRSLVWPLWVVPLAPPAVRVLLAHPALELTGPLDGRSVSGRKQLHAMGVRAVYAASRRTTAQGDGPIGSAKPLWIVEH